MEKWITPEGQKKEKKICRITKLGKRSREDILLTDRFLKRLKNRLSGENENEKI